VVWNELNFSIEGAHYYVYNYVLLTPARFSAQATGDLDCNGVTSMFRSDGAVMNDSVIGSGLQVQNETE
jgi:hypothetical protein